MSLLARDLLPGLLAPPRPAGPAGTARDLMVNWDGAARPDAPQPLLFNAWWREVGRLALAEGGVPAGAWSPGAEFVRMVLSDRGAPWCGRDGCAALSARAWEGAVAALATRFGPDPARWRWGDAHRARMEHPLLRFVPLLNTWLRIEVETAGDGETINRGGLSRDFSHVHGPGLRMIADLSGPDGIWAGIATGQSGNPFSRHWGDAAPGWAAGRNAQLTAAAPAAARLRLTP